MSYSIESAVAAIREHASGEIPRVALQLGSGLNDIAEAIENAVVISYEDIPGFPLPTVEGHAGRLLIGDIDGAPVLCLQGRVHFYEGTGLAPAVHMIRTLKALGVEIVVLTNAAGSLISEMVPGSLMVINDHINFSGANPLIGLNDDAIGPRFPDMTTAWDPELSALLHQAAQSIDTEMYEGVYLMVTGPSLKRQLRSGHSRRWARTRLACPRCRNVLWRAMRVCGLRAFPQSQTWRRACLKFRSPMRKPWPKGRRRPKGSPKYSRRFLKLV